MVVAPEAACSADVDLAVVARRAAAPAWAAAWVHTCAVAEEGDEQNISEDCLNTNLGQL